MINKNQAVLGLISLVVIASGCTQGGSSGEVTVTQNQGITVQSFSIFPNPMLADTTGDLTLRLQNTGEAEATNVEATVYNVPWADPNGQSTWSHDQGGEDDPTIDFPNLQAPNPDAGIPSTAVERILQISSPTGESGINTDYEFMTDISYDYTTTAEASVTVMGEERYRDERPTRSRPTVENTGGPIQVDIRTESPIIYRGGDTTKQVCFQVRNVGGGRVSTQGGEGDAVELSITIPGVNSNVGTVPVSRQTDRGGECIDLGGDLTEPDQQETFPIEVTATYNYEKTERASVTVEDTS